MKFGKKTLTACAMFALLAAAGPATAATDAVQLSVTPNGPRLPIRTENGSGLTNGTYAIGTIQLFYTVQGFQFPTGTFATFDVGMAIATAYNSNTKQTTSYPVQVTLEQIGGDKIALTPATSTFSVTGTGWTGGTTVTISIPNEIAEPHDGEDLVANMRLTTPAGSHLDTVTNIQVHIKLVFPTACLKLYNFVTDEALTTMVTAIDVNVNARKGTVSSTNPFGNLSDNVMVVNTCSVPESFDLKVNLDSWFRTNPYDNPGNAVTSFTTEGEIDLADFFTTAFGTGTPRGQALTFTNLTLGAGDTFLLTVHMSINKGGLWNGGVTGTFTGFSAGVYATGSGFTTPHSDVAAPNPATVSLGYTMK